MWAIASLSSPSTDRFAAEEALLTEVLREVIALGDGPDAVDAARRGDRARPGGAGRRRAGRRRAGRAGRAGWTSARTEVLVRALTRWFQLDQPRRGQRAGPPAARPRRARDAADRARDAGSLARGDRRRCADAGTTADELGEVLAPGRAAAGDDRAPDRGPAPDHDRQARAGVRGAARARRARPTADARADARRRLLATVQELWGSDDLRAAELTVLDEVRGGLIHFASTLADTVPADLPRPRGGAAPSAIPAARRIAGRRRCSASAPGSAATATATRSSRRRRRSQALELMREQCLRLLEARLEQLAGRLSLSERLDRPGPGLEPILAAGERRFPELAERAGRAQPRGALPPRADASCASASARRAGGATPAPTPSRPSCSRTCAASSARCGADGARSPPPRDLRDVIRQVEVFGFHFARLDIREHAKVHRARAGRDLSRRSASATDYDGLPEDRAGRAARRPDRRSPAADPRRHRAASREPTRETLDDLPHAARDAARRPPRRDPAPTSSRAPRARPTCSRCCC